MADRIKGITIEIDGNTSNLQKSLKSLDSSLNGTKNKLKDIEKLLKLDPKNTELLTQKQKGLEDAIKGTKVRLNELKTAQEGVAKGSEEWDAIQREIIDTEQQLQRLEQEYRNFGSVAAQQVKAVGEGMKEVGGKMESAGKTLTTTVTAPIVAGFTAAVKTTADFDEAMSQVAATMARSTDDMGELRDFAREMGATTAFSATEAAEAMNYMALAGYNDTEIMQMLPTVLNLAAAGNIDLAEASDMVTDAQSALDLTAEETIQMVDQMAAASSKSNTSVAQLGEGFLKIGATARNLKGGTQELATVLGVLADNGIKGAEGGTHLRNILLSLQDSAENGAVKFGDFSVEIYDAEGNMRSMIDIIGDLQSGLGGMSQEAKDALISGVFNKTDLAAVNALLGTTSERYNELSTAIGNSSGAAQKMADTQLDNLNGQLTLLKSALQELAISIGDILMPIVRNIVEKIQGWVDKFNSLDDRTKKIIVTVAAVVAAIGPLLIIGGKLITGIGMLLTFAPMIAAAIAAINWPIVLIVAAIGLLVAAGVALYKNWDEIKAKATEFWEGVKAGFRQLGEDIKAAWNNMTESIKAAWENAKTTVTQTATNLWQSIVNSFETLKDRVSSIWESIKEGITQPIQSARDTIANLIEQIRGFLNTHLSFPHIRLPHFSWTWSDLGVISIPHISVEWYKKAYDQPYMFTSPTVIGNRGFGDGNGAEMVYGKDSLMRDIKDAMTSVSGSQPIMITVQSVLDGRIIGQSVTRYQNGMARAMGV